MRLDITAEYIPEGDTIIASAYILDEITEVFHPEELRAGEASITYLGTSITKAIKFDRRMGTADGGFNFVFSHPPKTKNIQFKVSVTLMNDTVFTRSVGVRTEGDTNIPLIENLPEGTDFRSHKREVEGL